MIYLSMSKNYFILTFPRSGSHFLREYMIQATGKFLLSSHEYDDYLKIQDVVKDNTITILRNPVDTIASLSVIIKHSKKNIDQEGVSDQSFVDDAKSMYIGFYKDIVPRINYVIDYEKLINNPKDVMKSISAKLRLELITTEYKNRLVDSPESNYLVTSTASKDYQIFKELVGNEDLTECWELYNNSMKLVNI